MDGHREGKSLEEIRSGAGRVLQGREPHRGAAGVSGAGEEAVVIEHLRLQVPEGSQEAWLQAELQTWDPWLRQQSGFLGREVLWDKVCQEGVLLIHWASHAWKAIPEPAMAATQASFEAAAKASLGLPADSDNPFPLVFAGEVPPA
ncbi:MAG: TIGR03792 family protein [Cyanobacteriota bacterium]|nr:TIGR03792 family protein [Cyanobacteriota bacterium]